MSAEQIVPDSEHRGLVGSLPQPLRDLTLLARFDRPIGWWLLFWPCAWGVWLAGAGWQFALVGWLLVTPRMHAIHHSTARAQRDRNFSSGLAVWDRLHRTLRLDAQPGEVEIGIPGYLDEGAVTLRRVLRLPFGSTTEGQNTENTESFDQRAP